MKTIKTLLLLICCAVLTSCSSDDDPNDFSIDEDSLIQTTWGGTIVKTSGSQVIIQQSVLMQFFTEREGQCITEYDNEKSSDVYPFTYSIDGKIITISGILISGKYTLVDFNKSEKKIVLEAYPECKVTLTLYRKY